MGPATSAFQNEWTVSGVLLGPRWGSRGVVYGLGDILVRDSNRGIRTLKGSSW